MKLNKNAVRIIVLAGIMLVVFNVIAFVVPFAKNAVFWVAYAFGMTAIISQLAVMKLAFNGAETIRSKFYGFPVARIGVIYGICQLLLSFAAMALSPYIPMWIIMVIFIVMLAAAAAGMIGADMVREDIEHLDKKLVKNVSNMRELQSKISLIVSQADCGEELKSALAKLGEDIKYSDPVSNPATEKIENELLIAIDELQKAVIDGEETAALTLCRKISGTLAERNRLCKLNKNTK